MKTGTIFFDAAARCCVCQQCGKLGPASTAGFAKNVDAHYIAAFTAATEAGFEFRKATREPLQLVLVCGRCKADFSPD